MLHDHVLKLSNTLPLTAASVQALAILASILLIPHRHVSCASDCTYWWMNDHEKCVRCLASSSSVIWQSSWAMAAAVCVNHDVIHHGDQCAWTALLSDWNTALKLCVCEAPIRSWLWKNISAICLLQYFACFHTRFLQMNTEFRSHILLIAKWRHFLHATANYSCVVSTPLSDYLTCPCSFVSHGDDLSYSVVFPSPLKGHWIRSHNSGLRPAYRG